MTAENGSKWVYGQREPDPQAQLDEQLRTVDLLIAQAMDLLGRAAGIIDEIRHGQ